MENRGKPSGYSLSRAWFDFAFDNPDKINVNHTGLFMWLIELNNRKGWAEKFPFNTEDACTACGILNRKTIWKALNELVEFGFVTMVFKSSHRHKATIISILNNKVSSSDSLDKSLNYLSEIRTSTVTVSGPVEEQYEDQLGISGETVSGHSYKQENNKPKTINKEYLSDPLFDEFWNLYNKKTGKEKVRAKWSKLSLPEQSAIIKALPGYIKITPEVKFRKDPLTYLNGRHWEDELTTESKEPAVSSGFVLAQKPIGYTKHS